MRSLRLRTSSNSKWSAGRQQKSQAAAHRPPLCEFLENRRLLSVTAAEAADGISQQEQNVIGTYTGELTLRRADDQGRRNYDMTLTITSQGNNGEVDGTVTIEPQDATGNSEEQTSTFNNGDFSSAPRWRMHLDLDLNGEFDGRFDGHVNPNNEDRIEGGLRDAENRKFGSFRLNQTDDGGNGTPQPNPNPTPTPTPNPNPNPTPTPTPNPNPNPNPTPTPTPTPTGTQPTGDFPAPGQPGFVVREVNAEAGVTMTTLEEALDILVDGDLASQGGNANDSDEADAIAHYGVQQVNFGTDQGPVAGPNEAQFQTIPGAGHDNVALAAAGSVSVVQGSSVTLTLGVETNGSARLFLNGLQIGEVLDTPGGTGTATVQVQDVTLNTDDRIEVVYLESDTPVGTELLNLYALVGGTDSDGDGIIDEGTQTQVPLGSQESGVLISAPTLPPGGFDPNATPPTGGTPTPTPNPTDPTNPFPPGFPFPPDFVPPPTDPTGGTGGGGTDTGTDTGTGTGGGGTGTGPGPDNGIDTPTGPGVNGSGPGSPGGPGVGDIPSPSEPDGQPDVPVDGPPIGDAPGTGDDDEDDGTGDTESTGNGLGTPVKGGVSPGTGGFQFPQVNPNNGSFTGVGRTIRSE